MPRKETTEEQKERLREAWRSTITSAEEMNQGPLTLVVDLANGL